MPVPSAEIIQLLATFAPAFSAPSYAHALVLLYGTILAPGRRTVTAALRAVGRSDEAHFTNYHRFFNRAQWSGWVLSQLLLGLLIRFFLTPEAPLLLLIDETLERRRGVKIVYKGWFRDAVLSSANHVTKSLGIRWCCVCLLVPVPWSQRAWALPFVLMPVLAPKTSAQLGKGHRTSVARAAYLVAKVRRWQPQREIVLVGDGAYAAIELVQQCQGLTQPVKLVSRLRLDAALYDFAGPQPAGKRGPKPKKGARQASLQERLCDPRTRWQRVTVAWYGGQPKELEIVSGVSLWWKSGLDPVPLRWVLVRDPASKLKPAAFFCSDTLDRTITPEQIVVWFLGRWNIEVTFEEVRAHLGFETQRQWSPRAIGRTTPCLFGVFSLVVLMAKVLYPTKESLPLQQSRWYPKVEATFSDVLAAVRGHLWSHWQDDGKYKGSAANPDLCLIPKTLWLGLQAIACRAN